MGGAFVVRPQSEAFESIDHHPLSSPVSLNLTETSGARGHVLVSASSRSGRGGSVHGRPESPAIRMFSDHD